MPITIDELTRYLDGGAYRATYQFTSRLDADRWLDARAQALVAAGLATLPARVTTARRYGDGATTVAHLISEASNG